jgi:hypothetical protein
MVTRTRKVINNVSIFTKGSKEKRKNRPAKRPSLSKKLTMAISWVNQGGSLKEALRIKIARARLPAATRLARRMLRAEDL